MRAPSTSAGATIMEMIKRTSMTSINGVTLGVACAGERIATYREGDGMQCSLDVTQY